MKEYSKERACSCVYDDVSLRSTMAYDKKVKLGRTAHLLDASYVTKPPTPHAPKREEAEKNKTQGPSEHGVSYHRN